MFGLQFPSRARPFYRAAATGKPVPPAISWKRRFVIGPPTVSALSGEKSMAFYEEYKERDQSLLGLFLPTFVWVVCLLHGRTWDFFGVVLFFVGIISSIGVCVGESSWYGHGVLGYSPKKKPSLTLAKRNSRFGCVYSSSQRL